ncbi:MAG: hypothetical protein FIA92_01500 [Chloroflexi bacterium]|nr:hypothetical protein [Chloroflexota bacterium]
MTAPARRPGTDRPRILVWLDGREATIVRSGSEGPSLERVFATEPVPSHGSGRRRHAPNARHGEEWKGVAERRSERRLEDFLAKVAARLEPGADLEIIGPGPVHERLAREIVAADVRHANDRSVRAEAASRLTVPQLQARLREAIERTAEGPGTPPRNSNSGGIR